MALLNADHVIWLLEKPSQLLPGSGRRSNISDRLTKIAIIDTYTMIEGRPEKSGNIYDFPRFEY